MFRAERNFRFSRLNFSIGALPIIRINRDEITAADGTRNDRTKRTAWPSPRWLPQATASMYAPEYACWWDTKIFNRDINPDGLTRELITTVSYFYRF